MKLPYALVMLRRGRPKLETISKFKIRMTKTNADLCFDWVCFEFWSFELRACFGFRASDFGFSTSLQF
jgi:hypothetical protein